MPPFREKRRSSSQGRTKEEEIKNSEKFKRGTAYQVSTSGIQTLESVGSAILQCGASTLIAVIPLGFVGAHIIRFFFRTVVLVVSFGLLHALILLPVLLPCLQFPTALKRREPLGKDMD